LGEALDDLFGVDACALAIPSGKTIYVTKWIEGLDRVRLSKALKLQKVHGYRYIVLHTERDGKGEKAGDRAFSILEVPLLKGQHGIGTLSLFKEGERAFGQEVKGSISILSEVFSSMILPFISLDPRSRGESEDESLKLELLEAVGDERMMRLVLLRMLKLSRAEFCAFYTAENRGYFYIMLEGRELSPRIREIREKLKTAYCMFANRQDTKGMLVESVYYKRQENNVTYLLGNSKIESYFLVPVTFDSSVRGLLFFGSVRKDAFGRDDISIFRRLADEGGDRTPLVFKLGGETGILEGLLNSIPFGGALVSNEGRIICANVLFMETLRMNGSIPEMIQEIGRFSPFNLQGVWEEFGVLRRNLVDRELHSVSVPGRVVAVTWVRLENVSEDVGSVVFLKDVTAMREQEEAREDMLATVAHELRTPMTALKNSIEIMLEADCCNNEFRGRERHESPYSSSRFMNIALRTIKRLGMLVDGLIDVSQAGAGGRPLEPVRVNVTEFLEDASFLFLEPMRKKDIDFEINVDESLW
ncbi:MAG: GAF domain-containing protein, partial [Candidatus Krumholzibacteria bacterium]|nr:GAF domain-containing protein [Candidatus Krumholzibacteria bacterium]